MKSSGPAMLMLVAPSFWQKEQLQRVAERLPSELRVTRAV